MISRHEYSPLPVTLAAHHSPLLPMRRWELALLLSEVGILSGSAGPEQEAATRMWLSQIDEDGNGTIEWAELLKWWLAPAGGKAIVAAARLVEKLRTRIATSRRAGADGAISNGRYTGCGQGKGDSFSGKQGLSDADRHALRSLFTRHDKDLSGYIDQGELLPLLRELGVVSMSIDAEGEGGDDADELLAEMEMAEMDANGDDKISFDELCDWWVRTGRGAPPQRPEVAAAKAITKRLEAEFLHD